MNKLDKLLAQAHRFRSWLGQPEATLFNEYLNDYRNETLSKLASSNDTVELHRFQGALKVLDAIIELRGQMDAYIKGVADGTMRKIETKENTNEMGRKAN